jgi:methylamine dehydrogenase accessory protein MauD
MGSAAPAFQLPELDGQTLTLHALTAMGKPTLLVFADPTCGPCAALLPDLGRYQRDYPEQVTLALITRGTAEDYRAKAREHGLAHVLFQQDREVAQTYHVAGTPSAVLVRSDGTIGSPLAQGTEHVRALMDTLVAPSASRRSRPKALPMVAAPAIRVQHHSGPVVPARSAPARSAPASRIGEAVVPLSLPTLQGTTVSLGELGGGNTFVLFWNPSCGYCQRMLDALHAWEANPPADAPRLLVISSGTAQATRAQGFRAQVLLDDGFSAGQLFGVGGTPTGVLVDEHGTIVSAPAVGAQEVEAVLGIVRAYA